MGIANGFKPTNFQLLA